MCGLDRSMALKLESISESPRAVVLRILCAPESPEGLLKHRLLGPISRVCGTEGEFAFLRSSQVFTMPLVCDYPLRILV